MNPVVLALLLAATPPRMTFWGGSVAIPPGCSGPSTVRMNVDWFLGTIVCPEAQLTIRVAGGMVDSACSPAIGPKPRSARLLTVGGQELLLCNWSPKTDAGRTETHLAADIGIAHLRADVQSALAARLFLEVASSYEASGRK